MDGMNSQTGKTLSGIDHLYQSISDILTTRVGSRVIRRDYGSELLDLIDAPLNSKTVVRFYAATAKALAKWEPRFKLKDCKITNADIGAVVIDLSGTYLPDGKEITLQGIVIK